jgi:signal transduction histidine kinase
MIRQFLNWRTALALIGVAIVIGSIIYSNFLAKKIAKEEREKVSQWMEANKFALNAQPGVDLTLASEIQRMNEDIPIILTDEKNNILDHRNLDSLKALDSNYLKKKLKDFSKRPPLVQVITKEPYLANKYYYGESDLLIQMRYYPIVQLVIVGIFIFITLYAITTRNKSTQNQVWAGMAKETAHQLGTPLSSLQGWVEMLKEMPGNEQVAKEMEKDVDRLKLVSDRFGKIGSTPKLEEKDVLEQVKQMVAYIKRRAPEKVSFTIEDSGQTPFLAKISGPLFDWVIENLLKNALDSMEGRGSIGVRIKQDASQIYIDVADSGKGISPNNISKVFKPGFTTKKRGWGLGLSLSKRIIEQYHKGQIYVKHSEVGKGTTFRILLKKEISN